MKMKPTWPKLLQNVVDCFQNFEFWHSYKIQGINIFNLDWMTGLNAWFKKLSLLIKKCDCMRTTGLWSNIWVSIFQLKLKKRKKMAAFTVSWQILCILHRRNYAKNTGFSLCYISSICFLKSTKKFIKKKNLGPKYMNLDDFFLNTQCILFSLSLFCA